LSRPFYKKASLPSIPDIFQKNFRKQKKAGTLEKSRNSSHKKERETGFELYRHQKG